MSETPSKRRKSKCVSSNLLLSAEQQAGIPHSKHLTSPMQPRMSSQLAPVGCMGYCSSFRFPGLWLATRTAKQTHGFEARVHLWGEWDAAPAVAFQGCGLQRAQQNRHMGLKPACTCGVSGMLLQRSLSRDVACNTHSKTDTRVSSQSARVLSGAPATVFQGCGLQRQKQHFCGSGASSHLWGEWDAAPAVAFQGCGLQRAQQAA